MRKRSNRVRISIEKNEALVSGGIIIRLVIGARALGPSSLSYSRLEMRRQGFNIHHGVIRSTSGLVTVAIHYNWSMICII